MSTAARVAPIVTRSEPPRPGGRARRGPSAGLPVLIVVGAVACSPLAFGYYSFMTWAPLGLGAIVLLATLAFAGPPPTTRQGRITAAGLGLLVALSFASILWSQSRDAAWTSANRIAVYTVVFAIGLLAIRSRRTARATMVALGLPALLSAAFLALELVSGAGAGAFLQGRLEWPMGYINGSAGLFVMGIWPWLGLAETLRSRWLRALAISAAALIASTAALTQSRAILLATAATIVLVLVAAPGRTRRAINLIVVLVAVIATATWTLRVYSSTGPAQTLAPGAGILRDAGLAVFGAAAAALVLKLVASACAERLSAVRRERISLTLGRALLVLAVAATITGAIAGRSRIATQWHDFTALRAEQSAQNRYLAIGGGYRYDLWRIALEEFAHNPLGGVGAGNFVDSYYLLRHQLEDVTVPHSLELQVLADLGVGGGLGLLLLVGGVLAAGFDRHGRTLASSDPGLRVGALGVFVAWLAATSVDWLYDIPGLAAMALLAAAVLVVPAAGAASIDGSGAPIDGSGAPIDGTQPPRGRRAQAVLVSVLALLALVAASVGRQYVAMLYSDTGQSLASRRPLRALANLRTAEQLDPWSLQTQYAVAAAYARMDDYGAARAALLRAEQLEPDNYVPPALLGDIATREGDIRTALAAYRRALALDPLEPALRQAVASASRALAASRERRG